MDALLDRACGYAAARPRLICAILCAFFLLGGTLETLA